MSVFLYISSVNLDHLTLGHVQLAAPHGGPEFYWFYWCVCV